MRPHPRFANWMIPDEHILGVVKLKALSVDDLNRDYDAIIESATDIKAANPSLTWPDGLTRQQNLIDLAWHQKEFQSRRSFAYAIENADGMYLGCVYVYPSISGENAADVTWWWRTGVSVNREKFRDELVSWLSSEDWPPLDYRFRNE